MDPMRPLIASYAGRFLHGRPQADRCFVCVEVGVVADRSEDLRRRGGRGMGWGEARNLGQKVDHWDSLLVYAQQAHRAAVGKIE